MNANIIRCKKVASTDMLQHIDAVTCLAALRCVVPSPSSASPLEDIQYFMILTSCVDPQRVQVTLMLCETPCHSTSLLDLA